MLDIGSVLSICSWIIDCNFVYIMYSTEQKSIKVRSIGMCSHLTVRMFIE